MKKKNLEVKDLFNLNSKQFSEIISEGESEQIARNSHARVKSIVKSHINAVTRKGGVVESIKGKNGNVTHIIEKTFKYEEDFYSSSTGNVNRVYNLNNEGALYVLFNLTGYKVATQYQALVAKELSKLLK